MGPQTQSQVEKLENKLRLRHKTVEGLVSRLNELSRAHTAADNAGVEAAKADLQARLDASEHAKTAAEAQARAGPAVVLCRSFRYRISRRASHHPMPDSTS